MEADEVRKEKRERVCVCALTCVYACTRVCVRVHVCEVHSLTGAWALLQVRRGIVEGFWDQYVEGFLFDYFRV